MEIDMTTTAPAGDGASAADLLYGAPAIARFLRLSEPQARHLCENGTLPTFKVGKLICARETTLLAWIAECEAKAGAGRQEPGAA
jgi:hypothetical protein